MACPARTVADWIALSASFQLPECGDAELMATPSQLQDFFGLDPEEGVTLASRKVVPCICFKVAGGI